MQLFPSYEDDKKYDYARKTFSETNNNMIDLIHSKTIDTENINYGKVQTTIYETVGLGKQWRVDKSQSANEIETASNGFEKVSDGIK